MGKRKSGNHWLIPVSAGASTSASAAAPVGAAVGAAAAPVGAAAAPPLPNITFPQSPPAAGVPMLPQFPGAQYLIHSATQSCG